MTLGGTFDGNAFVEILDVEFKGGFVFMCTGTKGLAVYKAPAGTGPTYRVHSGSLGSGSHGSYPRCQHIEFKDVPADPGAETVDLFVTNRGDETQPTPWIKWVRIEGGLDAFTPEYGTQHTVVSTLSGSLATESYEGLAYKDGYLYAMAHGAGIVIIDTADGLKKIGTAAVPGNAFDARFAADGTLVVVTSDAGLHTYDVTDPTQPKHLGAAHGGAALTRVEVEGQIAYAAGGNTGLEIYDISDAANPALLSVFETPGTVMDINVSGDHAVIANWVDVRVVNVADPATPWLVAAETVPSQNKFSRVLTADIVGDEVRVGEWTALLSYTVHPEHAPPDIHVQQKQLQFKDGETSKGVVVTNEGLHELVIAKVSIGSAAFAVGPAAANIAPGDKAFFEVSWTGAMESGWLKFESNDPDEANLSIKAGAVPITAGIGVGDTIPESWQVIDLKTGQPTSLKGLIAGNVAVLAYFSTF